MTINPSANIDHAALSAEAFMFETIEAHPLTPTIGAEIAGIDLGETPVERAIR